MDWAEDYKVMIEDCENRESKLTDWERGFLDSLSKQLETRAPSVKQIETLENIWERVT